MAEGVRPDAAVALEADQVPADVVFVAAVLAHREEAEDCQRAHEIEKGCVLDCAQRFVLRFLAERCEARAVAIEFRQRLQRGSTVRGFRTEKPEHRVLAVLG